MKGSLGVKGHRGCHNDVPRRPALSRDSSVDGFNFVVISQDRRRNYVRHDVPAPAISYRYDVAFAYLPEDLAGRVIKLPARDAVFDLHKESFPLP